MATADQADQIIVPKGADAGTFASNPGRFHADFLTVAKCYPKAYVAAAAIALFGAVITFLVTVIGGDVTGLAAVAITTAIGAFFAWFVFQRPKITASAGCVLPGFVLDAETGLVAVMTDLTKGGRPYPAVKILATPLRRSGMKSLKKGQRMPFVALYEDGNPTGPSWTDFHPLPVPCLTPVRATWKRVAASIPPEDWEELQEALRRLQRPLRVGLYNV